MTNKTAKWTLGEDEIMQMILDQANSDTVRDLTTVYIHFYKNSGYDKLLEYFESKNIGLRIPEGIGKYRSHQVKYMIDVKEITDIKKDHKYEERLWTFVRYIKKIYNGNKKPTYLSTGVDMDLNSWYLREKNNGQ